MEVMINVYLFIVIIGMVVIVVENHRKNIYFIFIFLKERFLAKKCENSDCGKSLSIKKELF